MSLKDSDTNPNTTASSIAGDTPFDGRKKRSEATQLRKSVFGKKHRSLDESKVGLAFISQTCNRRGMLIALNHLRRMTLSAASGIYSA